MPVTMLHGTVDGGNYCSYCGKHRMAWKSDEEPCDGEVPVTEEAVARAEDAIADAVKQLGDSFPGALFCPRCGYMASTGGTAAGDAPAAAIAAAQAWLDEANEEPADEQPHSIAEAVRHIYALIAACRRAAPAATCKQSLQVDTKPVVVGEATAAAISDGELAELERLEAGATKGDWRASGSMREVYASDPYGFTSPFVVADCSGHEPFGPLATRHPDTVAKANAALIVALRNKAKALIAACRDQGRRLEQLEKEQGRHVCFCGLPMVKNPHPDSGDPKKLLEVGAMFTCVPCTQAALHKVSTERDDLRRRVRELGEALAAADIGLLAAIACTALKNTNPKFVEQLRGIRKQVKAALATAGGVPAGDGAATAKGGA